MAKLPGRIPASQVTRCSTWLPPEIDGNGKTIRLMSQLKPGKMDLRLEATKEAASKLSRAPDPPVIEPSAEALAKKAPQTEPQTEPPSQAPSTENLSTANPSTTNLPATNSSEATSSDPEVTASVATAADTRSEADGYADGFKKGETEGFIKGEKSGQDAGFDVGSKSGKQQAEADFTAEVAAQRSAIQSLQQAFVQPPDYDKNLQEGLVDLITELTKVVVSHEIKTRPEFIQELVEQALSALPHGTTIPRVFVNPNDIEFLQSMSSHDVELVADAGVARGGCRVVAGQSQIEAGLSMRISEALTAACRGEAIPAIKDIDLQKIESVIEVDSNHYAEE